MKLNLQKSLALFPFLNFNETKDEKQEREDLKLINKVKKSVAKKVNNPNISVEVKPDSKVVEIIFTDSKQKPSSFPYDIIFETTQSVERLIPKNKELIISISDDAIIEPGFSLDEEFKKYQVHKKEKELITSEFLERGLAIIFVVYISLLPKLSVLASKNSSSFSSSSNKVSQMLKPDPIASGKPYDIFKGELSLLSSLENFSMYLGFAIVIGEMFLLLRKDKKKVRILDIKYALERNRKNELYHNLSERKSS
jgi:hypothetical protein